MQLVAAMYSPLWQYMSNIYGSTVHRMARVVSESSRQVGVEIVVQLARQ